MAEPARRRPWRRDLRGARAVVTGGSSGVGRALALELVRRGARVLATARRGDRLEALAADAARLASAPLVTRVGDVTDPAFRRALVAETVSTLGGIDLLVAAAGSGAIGPFRTADAATLERIMAVDFTAPVELVRECLPVLVGGRDPAILLVGSILGRHPLPLHAEYCAAKAALASVAGTLRLELAAAGVDVLLASLGPTESEFWDQLLVGRRPAWSRGRQMPADRTARIVLDALARRRREVFPGLQAKGFAVAARLFPRLLDRAILSRLRRNDTP
jgi:short-subunit dehydrogenase